jgi:hypothetical protein
MGRLACRSDVVEALKKWITSFMRLDARSLDSNLVDAASCHLL